MTVTVGLLDDLFQLGQILLFLPFFLLCLRGRNATMMHGHLRSRKQQNLVCEQDGQSLIESIRRATGEDLHQHLPGLVCREHIPDPIETRRELKREDGAGDIDYNPSDDKEREEFDGDESRGDIHDQEVDVHIQPKYQPCAHELATANTPTFFKSPDRAAQAQRTNESEDARQSIADDSIVTNGKVSEEPKLRTDTIDGHQAEELHDNGQDHGDCVIQHPVALSSRLNIDRVGRPWRQENLQSSTVLLIHGLQGACAIHMVVGYPSHLDQLLKRGFEVAVRRRRISSFVEDVGKYIRAVVKRSGVVAL